MKTDNQTNNKRIAKNTFFLYIRMGVLMVITLFTSRILLEKLGIEDYGIYNLVGGLASMFAFFSSSLSNASQRFLNVSLAKNDVDYARKIVSQHFTLYLLFCIIIVVVAETFGYWFLVHKLVIPPCRLDASIWIFQFFVISLCVTLLGIIFNSEIIAHEDMNLYAYVGIFEGVAKLLICYLVTVSPIDKLIFYGFLLLIVSFLTQGLFAFYSFKKYEECNLSLMWDKKLIKDTSSIIGWNAFGTFVFAINDQGINILLNLFFGPVVNAARAICFQVNSAINSFSENFFKSINPQITKNYAVNNIEYLRALFYKSSKYGFLLFWLISLPIMLNIDQILSIWLVEVPDYTNFFTVLILIYSLVNILTKPGWTITLASGKMSRYMMIGSSVFLMVFPISYILLKLGCSPIVVFYTLIVVRAVYLIVSLRLIKDYFDYSYKDYILSTIIPIIKVVVVSCLLLLVIRSYWPVSICSLILFVILSLLVVGFVIFYVGIDSNERDFINRIILKKIKE